MSDLLPKTVNVKLGDGNTYTLTQFHLNAQVAVQDRYGIDFENANFVLLEEVETWPIDKSSLAPNSEGKIPVSGFYLFLMRHLGKSAQAVRFLVWQLLSRNHRELTEEDVGFLITPDIKESVFREVLKLYTGSHPGTAEEKKILLTLVSQMGEEKVA